MKQIRPNRKSGGFSVFEAMLVVAVLVFLLALFLPALGPAHRQASRLNCNNCLKQIGLAYRQWSMDNGDKYPDQVSVTNGGTMELVSSGLAYVHFLALSNELNTPKILLCPADTNRIAATEFISFNNGNLSYFAALDGSESQLQMFLSGDDNFTVNGVKPKRSVLDLWTNSPIAWLPTRHNLQGNILLGDGSVQGFNSRRLQQALGETGVATNRLVMP